MSTDFPVSNEYSAQLSDSALAGGSTKPAAPNSISGVTEPIESTEQRNYVAPTSADRLTSSHTDYQSTVNRPRGTSSPFEIELHRWEQRLRESSFHDKFGDLFYPEIAKFLATQCPDCDHLRRKLSDAYISIDDYSVKIRGQDSLKADVESSNEEIHKLSRALENTQNAFRSLKEDHIRLLIKTRDKQKAKDALDDLLGEDNNITSIILELKHGLAELYLADQEDGLASPLLNEVLRGRAKERDEKYWQSFRQYFEVLRNLKQFEAARQMLHKEEGLGKLRDDWALELGDMWVSVFMDLNKLESAKAKQKELLVEMEKRLGKHDHAITRGTVRLANLWRCEAWNSGPEDKNQCEKKNIEILQGLMSQFSGNAFADPPDELLREIYEAGTYYFSQQKWEEAKVLFEWTRSHRRGPKMAELSNEQQMQLLGDLVDMCITKGVVEMPTIDEILRDLYKIRCRLLGQDNTRTLRCGYQLCQRLDKSGDAGRLAEAEDMMRDIFQRSREKLGSKPTKQLLDIALFYGHLLLKIAENRSIDYLTKAESLEVYQKAAVVFQIVWKHGQGCAEFSEKDAAKAGRSLMKCFKYQQALIRETVPELTNEIWVVLQRQAAPHEKPKLGKTIADILIGLGTHPAEVQAERVLRHLFEHSDDQEGRRSFGLCLARLSDFNQARQILQDVRPGAEVSIPDRSNWSRNLAYCLISLGSYDGAYALCEEILALPGEEDAGKKWAKASKDRIAEWREDKATIASHERQTNVPRPQPTTIPGTLDYSNAPPPSSRRDRHKRPGRG